MIMGRLLPLALRPYIFRELPAWGRLYQWARVDGSYNSNPIWSGAPVRIVRGKTHGYLMEVDLSDDVDRFVYFLGRYYDLDLQLLIDAIVGPGDTLVNVGANMGYVVLHAASRVGPQGRVLAFEPQIRCCQRLRRNLELNGITQVEVHNCALGERDDKLELKMRAGSTIMSTLCTDETDEPEIYERVEVDVRRGDDLVFDRVIGNLMLMVDVEGFELYVLRGLERTIARHRPPIVIEVIPRYLRRAGTSVEEQFAFFRDRDYAGYVIKLRKRDLLPLPGARRSDFVLRPIATPAELHEEADIDMLWLPKEGGRFDPTPHVVTSEG